MAILHLSAAAEVAVAAVCPPKGSRGWDCAVERAWTLAIQGSAVTSERLHWLAVLRTVAAPVLPSQVEGAACRVFAPSADWSLVALFPVV